MVVETKVGFLVSTNEFEFVRGEGLDQPGGQVNLTRATAPARDTLRLSDRTVEHHDFKLATALETLADGDLEP